MSIRGDLRVGETLRGSLRKKSHSYTVMGRVVLKRRDQRTRRLTRWEQWRLIDDDGQELWLEIQNTGAHSLLLAPEIAAGNHRQNLRMKLGIHHGRVTGLPKTLYCFEEDRPVSL